MKVDDMKAMPSEDLTGPSHRLKQCKQEIGQKLEKRRTARGERLDQVAAVLDLDPNEIALLEAGAFSEADLAALTKYAAYMGLATSVQDARADSEASGQTLPSISREDVGPLALANLLQLIGIEADPVIIKHKLSGHSFATLEALRTNAKILGFKARIIRRNWNRLARVPLPALASTKTGELLIVARVDTNGERLLLLDPFLSSPRDTSRQEFEDLWDGRLLLVGMALAPRAVARSGFSWFWATLAKYKVLIGELISASLFLQIIDLATPLFFQIIIDKVLVHRAWHTLDVLIFALVLLAMFEFVLGGLRSKLLAEAATKIDVELGGRLYRHLISLPLSYFSARRVGDSVAKLRELDRIREFMTGSALTAILDTFFTVVFLAVMALYSKYLTGIVVTSIAFYIFLSMTVLPTFRRRLEEQYLHSAESQAFVVETLTGIETMKSLAAEAQLESRWADKLAAYAISSLRVTKLADWAGHGVQLISKLTSLAVVYAGTGEVVSGTLSIGGLVAVNMMASRVTAPVLRLAQTWQDFQEARIAVDRLADITSTAPETSQRTSRSTLPTLRGEVTFERVTFRYPNSTRDVLRDLNLRIRAGEVVGIVGTSGSGKSTLARLVQGLHHPCEGRVMVDGVDLAHIEPCTLRCQIGVVPQESFLLNLSVRDNIAFTSPFLSMDEVIEVARLAGADEFIADLPQGYDTIVGERGSYLSGGQRQRLAIARALASSPAILILDEATSALDYESERIIRGNMRRIAANRTVIIIAHRLSAVRDADRIITIDQGKVVEDGAHDQLLRRGGRYAALHRAQSAGLALV